MFDDSDDRDDTKPEEIIDIDEFLLDFKKNDEQKRKNKSQFASRIRGIANNDSGKSWFNKKLIYVFLIAFTGYGVIYLFSPEESYIDDPSFNKLNVDKNKVDNTNDLDKERKEINRIRRTNRVSTPVKNIKKSESSSRSIKRSKRRSTVDNSTDSDKNQDDDYEREEEVNYEKEDRISRRDKRSIRDRSRRSSNRRDSKNSEEYEDNEEYEKENIPEEEGHDIVDDSPRREENLDREVEEEPYNEDY